MVWRGRKWGWSLQKTLHCRVRTSGDGMMNEGKGETGLSITSAWCCLSRPTLLLQRCC